MYRYLYFIITYEVLLLVKLLLFLNLDNEDFFSFSLDVFKKKEKNHKIHVTLTHVVIIDSQ